MSYISNQDIRNRLDLHKLTAIPVKTDLQKDRIEKLKTKITKQKKTFYEGDENELGSLKRRYENRNKYLSQKVKLEPLNEVVKNFLKQNSFNRTFEALSKGLYQNIADFGETNNKTIRTYEALINLVHQSNIKKLFQPNTVNLLNDKLVNFGKVLKRTDEETADDLKNVFDPEGSDFVDEEGSFKTYDQETAREVLEGENTVDKNMLLSSYIKKKKQGQDQEDKDQINKATTVGYMTGILQQLKDPNAIGDNRPPNPSIEIPDEDGEIQDIVFQPKEEILLKETIRQQLTPAQRDYLIGGAPGSTVAAENKRERIEKTVNRVLASWSASGTTLKAMNYGSTEPEQIEAMDDFGHRTDEIEERLHEIAFGEEIEGEDEEKGNLDLGNIPEALSLALKDKDYSALEALNTIGVINNYKTMFQRHSEVEENLYNMLNASDLPYTVNTGNFKNLTGEFDEIDDETKRIMEHYVRDHLGAPVNAAGQSISKIDFTVPANTPQYAPLFKHGYDTTNPVPDYVDSFYNEEGVKSIKGVSASSMSSADKAKFLAKTGIQKDKDGNPIYPLDDVGNIRQGYDDYGTMGDLPPKSQPGSFPMIGGITLKSDFDNEMKKWENGGQTPDHKPIFLMTFGGTGGATGDIVKQIDDVPTRIITFPADVAGQGNATASVASVVKTYFGNHPVYWGHTQPDDIQEAGGAKQKNDPPWIYRHSGQSVLNILENPMLGNEEGVVKPIRVRAATTDDQFNQISLQNLDHKGLYEFAKPHKMVVSGNALIANRIENSASMREREIDFKTVMGAPERPVKLGLAEFKFAEGSGVDIMDDFTITTSTNPKKLNEQELQSTMAVFDPNTGAVMPMYIPNALVATGNPPPIQGASASTTKDLWLRRLQGATLAKLGKAYVPATPEIKDAAGNITQVAKKAQKFKPAYPAKPGGTTYGFGKVKARDAITSFYPADTPIGIVKGTTSRIPLTFVDQQGLQATTQKVYKPNQAKIDAFTSLGGDPSDLIDPSGDLKDEYRLQDASNNPLKFLPHNSVGHNPGLKVQYLPESVDVSTIRQSVIEAETKEYDLRLKEIAVVLPEGETDITKAVERHLISSKEETKKRQGTKKVDRERGKYDDTVGGKFGAVSIRKGTSITLPLGRSEALRELRKKQVFASQGIFLGRTNINIQEAG